MVINNLILIAVIFLMTIIIVLHYYIEHVVKQLFVGMIKNKDYGVEYFFGLATRDRFERTGADLLLCYKVNDSDIEHAQNQHAKTQFLIRVPNGIPFIIRLFNKYVIYLFKKESTKYGSELEAVFMRDNDEIIMHQFSTN